MKNRSGLSDFALESLCRGFLDRHGRWPHLDELSFVNSEPSLRETLKSNKDSVKLDNVLLFGNTVEEANIRINDEYRDLEVEIIPIDERGLLRIKKRPTNSEPESDHTVTLSQNVSSPIVIGKAIGKLGALYGIKFNYVTDAEITAMDIDTNDKLVNAFVYNNEIYINLDRASVDAPIHELLHIFIGSMKFTNPELYYSLVNMAEQFPTYNSIAEQYANKLRSDLNEEVLITELAKYFSGKSSFLSNLDEDTLYEIEYNITRVLDSILMGYDSSKTISLNLLMQMSLKDIAKTVRSQVMSDNKTLVNAELHRRLSNMKSDLYKNNELLEICD